MMKTNLFVHKYCYCFSTVKWFQLFLSNTNNSIQYKSFVRKQWSGYRYCNLTLIILINTIQSNFHKYCYTILIIQFWHTYKEFQVLLCITNNLIKHQLFVHTHFKCQTVLFDPYIGPYQVLPLRVRVDLSAMAKEYSTFPKAGVSLSDGLELVEGGILLLCRDAVGVFYSPSWLGYLSRVNNPHLRVK